MRTLRILMLLLWVAALICVLLSGCGEHRTFAAGKLSVESVEYVILDSRNEFPYIQANVSVKNVGADIGRTRARVYVYNSTGEHIATVSEYVHNIRGGGQYTLIRLSFVVSSEDIKNWPWTESIRFFDRPAGNPIGP